MTDLMNGVFIVQFRVLFVLLDSMFFLVFNCVFLSALLYVLLPSGVINHVCMYVCIKLRFWDSVFFPIISCYLSQLCDVVCIGLIITLRASCGAVYCNRSCLSVCLWVCYHDNSKLRASIFTKLGL